MNCKNNAEYLIPWAGQILKQCEKHANQIATIAEAIGSPIQAQTQH